VYFLIDETSSWQCRQVKVGGTKPDIRCGSSLQSYLNTCILFGGVTDTEVDSGDNTASAKSKKAQASKMRSAFYNDLHRFDLHKLKWYPIEIKSEKTTAEASNSQTSPSSRMNAAMVIKQGILYIYGGLKELDEKKNNTHSVTFIVLI